MFKGRKLIIATKHGKEKVIAPVFEKQFEVNCFVHPDFDTDVLGTFDGEIERKNDPLTTVHLKCLMAMEKYDCDLGIASEGSFGPHPNFLFARANDELLIFIDKKNGLEVLAREISTETNFNGAVIKTESELREFADKVLFPSHALILRNEKDSLIKITKGIRDWETLLARFTDFKHEFGSAYVETDMRAMYNPTRMRLIEKTTIQLVSKLNSLCSDCGTPGFVVTNTLPGLPCSLCHSPTRSALYQVYRCQNCSCLKKEKFPQSKVSEEPMFCDVCNP